MSRTDPRRPQKVATLTAFLLDCQDEIRGEIFRKRPRPDLIARLNATINRTAFALVLLGEAPGLAAI